MAAQPPTPTDVPNTDNPFLIQEAAAGASDPPVAPSTTTSTGPPDYSEAVRQSINSPLPVAVQRRVVSGEATVTTQTPAATETASLLNRQSGMTRDAYVYASETNHVRQQRGLTRALLLWLGIGQWYSGVCIFISFVFFSGGAILTILSVLTLDALQTVKITTVAAGVIFVLLSILWPCAWLWNQWNMTCGCSYAPLIGYTWLLSLAYTFVVGALTSGVNEHYSCIHFCKNCTFEITDRYPCEFVQMSLWTLMAMFVLMLVFIVISCVYCCCCPTNREPRRGNYYLISSREH